jgi:hypothetical protein
MRTLFVGNVDVLTYATVQIFSSTAILRFLSPASSTPSLRLIQLRVLLLFMGWYRMWRPTHCDRY